jgi:predicted nuclease of predicted toxin-antitoxin system
MRSLLAAGHDVLRSVDILGCGAEDATVFAFACESGRAILTFDTQDFEELAELSSNHPGVLLIYTDNKPTDMAPTEIVRAVANVEAHYPVGINGQIIVLNAYRW